MIALGGAVAAAGVAFVGMAGAVVGAAVPAIIVFQGFMSRLSAVLDAVKKKQQADTQAKLDGKGPTSQLAQANEALRQAHQRAADAARGITDAEEALAQAQRTPATRSVTLSMRARRPTSASGTLRPTSSRPRSTGCARSATRPRRHATRCSTSRKPHLRVDEAKLNTRESVAELKKLRKESGLTGVEFESMFKEFTGRRRGLQPQRLPQGARAGRDLRHR